jgi:hypothetical protein
MSAKRFRIAFSFAGEKREFVGRVAGLLAQSFGEEAILYDKFHEAEFSRARLGRYLPKLYYEQSDLVVVVICRDYVGKEWCGLEWDAIFDLLKQRRESEVMLSRFNYAIVDGLFSDAGFSELDHKTPEQFAALILERFALNEGKPKNYYTKPERPSTPESPAPAIPVDIFQIGQYAPVNLIARESETQPALATQRLTIREKSAAEIIRNLKENTPSYGLGFHEKAMELYIGRWTGRGWKATVDGLPSKLSGGSWYCYFKEVDSSALIWASTSQDISTLRPGDSVTVSGRISAVSPLNMVSLEDAIVHE